MTPVRYSMRFPGRVSVLLSLVAVSIGLAACEPRTKALPQTENSIGITMVSLPAGSFTMGESVELSKARGRTASSPDHVVAIAAFQIARTEVTVGQYKAYLHAAGRDGQRKLQDTDFLKHNSYGDDVPVLNLKGNEVTDFISWLNSTDGVGYRLPSEAEWEYACRAGSDAAVAYCGGEDLDPLGWYGGNSGQTPQAVAQKKPNAFGLYDMSGNAEEWVADCWYHNYEGAPADGSARQANGGKCDFLVVRGGDYATGPLASRATARESKSPSFYHYATGFRLARTR
jgi:formylglycine-generating enzyme required for sulfatase activity